MFILLSVFNEFVHVNGIHIWWNCDGRVISGYNVWKWNSGERWLKMRGFYRFILLNFLWLFCQFIQIYIKFRIFMLCKCHGKFFSEALSFGVYVTMFSVHNITWILVYHWSVFMDLIPATLRSQRGSDGTKEVWLMGWQVHQDDSGFWNFLQETTHQKRILV